MNAVSAQTTLALWEQAKQHSNDYCKQLALTSEDLEFIQRNNLSCAPDGQKGFLSFVVSGKEFRVLVTRVSGRDYNETWRWVLQEICISDNKINRSFGTSNTSITCVSDDWHGLLLKQLPEDAAVVLRKKISGLMAKQANLWEQAKLRSADICQLLEVSKQDLPRIRACLVSESDKCPSGSFDCTIEGKNFRFTIDRVCGSLYGGSWEMVIQAACTSDASLNERIGGGTTLVSVIDEQWHRMLIQESNRHLFDSVKKRISDSAIRHESIWQQALQHSDEICLALNCSTKDDKVLAAIFPARPFTTHIGPFLGERVHYCSLEDKEFALCLIDTCGTACRDGWKKMIQVVCTSDKALNQSIGGGTTFVNVVEEPWHQKLLHHLKTLAAEHMEQALLALKVADSK